MCDDIKPDSTSYEEDCKPERMEIDEHADSVEQSISSKSEDKDSLLGLKDEPDAKSPVSSCDMKVEPEDELEEDTVENVAPGQKRRGRPPKPGNERKRRSRAKDANAPKTPINGYVRFLNENRERARKDHPEIPFASITKILAQEWSQLKQEDKQKYLDAADRDRERYTKEMEEYQRTDSYRQFKKHVEEEEAAKLKAKEDAKEADKKKTKADKLNRVNSGLKPNNGRPEDGTLSPSATPPPVIHQPLIRRNPDDTFDIPIFTEEFLDHNKTREAEMRQLRKSNTDLEEHNTFLTKHIDSYKEAIGKLESETEQHRHSNKQMESYLAKLRTRLVETLQEISLPGWETRLTVENIDNFMEQLHQYMKLASKDTDKTYQDIKSALLKIDCTDL